jgi:hypothetical protein
MSIAMEPFGSDEQGPELPVSDGWRSAVFPYRLQCRACGFEPMAARIPRGERCEKCNSCSWERFAFPRSLLINADRRAGNSPELHLSPAMADTT